MYSIIIEQALYYGMNLGPYTSPVHYDMYNVIR